LVCKQSNASDEKLGIIINHIMVVVGLFWSSPSTIKKLILAAEFLMFGILGDGKILFFFFAKGGKLLVTYKVCVLCNCVPKKDISNKLG